MAIEIGSAASGLSYLKQSRSSLPNDGTLTSESLDALANFGANQDSFNATDANIRATEKAPATPRITLSELLTTSSTGLERTDRVELSPEASRSIEGSDKTAVTSQNLAQTQSDTATAALGNTVNVKT